jgi:hypothetical protein
MAKTVAEMKSRMVNEEDFLVLFDFTIQAFKKTISRHCDEKTAETILKSTARELKKIVPKEYKG